MARTNNASGRAFRGLMVACCWTAFLRLLGQLGGGIYRGWFLLTGNIFRSIRHVWTAWWIVPQMVPPLLFLPFLEFGRWFHSVCLGRGLPLDAGAAAAVVEVPHETSHKIGFASWLLASISIWRLFQLEANNVRNGNDFARGTPPT